MRRLGKIIEIRMVPVVLTDYGLSAEVSTAKVVTITLSVYLEILRDPFHFLPYVSLTPSHERSSPRNRSRALGCVRGAWGGISQAPGARERRERTRAGSC